jgi:SAM-dependent methyltransferase
MPSLKDYLLRELNLFNRNAELRGRFGSTDNAEFIKFIETEAIIFFRELQEVGIPFPPSQEMLTVGGETDLRIFLSIGYTCFESVCRNIPADLKSPIKLLDFGIGCARTMRFFFREMDKFHCYGCDVDRKAISYIQDSIPFIKATSTKNLPPLPYPKEFFDLVYSVSVFSHLDYIAFHAWLAEIHRVLAWRGIFQVTIHGELAFSIVSNEPERRNLIGISENEFSLKKNYFDETGFVWMKHPTGSADIDTSQFGISFISRAQFEHFINPFFELVEYTSGEIGGWQDLAVMRKRTR